MSVATRDDLSVRVTYDSDANAAYIYLTNEALMPGRDTVPCATPGGAPGVEGMINLDFREGKLVGIEVLDAFRWLHRDLLDTAR
jgi:uncharacterized protein YuzE